MKSHFRLGTLIAICALLGAGAAFGGEWNEQTKMWPKAEHLWLPELCSKLGESVDSLFYLILILVTSVFLVTEGLLCAFIVLYRRKEGRKSLYSHGSHHLEVIWTVIPALTLASLAFIQKGAWEEIKFAKNLPNKEAAQQVQIFAEQFEWNFRYPGPDGKFGTADDFTTTKELVIPVNKKILVEQTSKDVIHSFFIPYMRLKQDAVPGMQIKLWFDCTKTTAEMRLTRPPYTYKDGKGKDVTVEWKYPIACAELCGNGHYNMWGTVTVVTEKEYEEWTAKKSKEFQSGDSEAPEIWSKFWPLDSQGRRFFGKIKAENEYVDPHPQPKHDEHGGGHAEHTEGAEKKEH